MPFLYSKLLYTSIKIALDEYGKYYEVIEEYFSKQIDDISITYDGLIIEDKHGKSSIPEEYSKEAEFLHEEFQQIERTFPQFFRRSFLIQLTSFIEFELKNICNKHSSITHSLYKVSDLHGNDLEKCKVYLTKSGKIHFEDISKEWEFIQLIFKLRNRFVHNAGTIDLNQGNTFKKFQQEKLIRFEDTPIDNFINIRINKKLSTALLRETNTFFNKLLIDLMDF